MRCLYCGETLAKPPEDAANAFCSIGHRQMYQWNRASTGNGASGFRPIGQLVAAAEAGEEGENALAGFRFRKRVPVEDALAICTVDAAAEPFPYPAKVPESLLASDLGLYEAWMEPCEPPSAFGPRKPRQPRMPLFAVFPVSRRLPGRSVRRTISMSLSRGIQVARIVESGRRMVRSKTERPLVFPVKAILGRLRASLRVTDMEPLPPAVENLREKAAAAAKLAPGVNDPPSSELMRLASHSPAPRPVMPRQSRSRDGVQWTARLVDLEGIGRRLLAAQVESARFPGVQSWRPGPVRAKVQPRPAAPSAAVICRGAESVIDLRTDALAGSALPESTLAAHNAQLTALGEPLDIELVCPPVASASVAGTRLLEAELETPEPQTLPSLPESRLAEMRPSLGAAFLISHSVELVSELPIELRGLDTSLLETSFELNPLSPVFTAPTRGARSSFQPAEQLVPLAVAPHAADTVRHKAGELSLLTIGAERPKPSAPPFSWRRFLAPPPAKTPSRLEPSAALAFSGPSFTQGDMAPINSEAKRVVPHLKARLIEDRAVAEAVQQYKEASRRGLLHSLLGRFRKTEKPAPNSRRKPTAATRTPAPALAQMKWALVALPVVLAIGFFLIRGGKGPEAEAQPETAPQVAQLPHPSKSAGGTATPARREKRKAEPKTPPAAETARVENVKAEPETNGFLAGIKQAILKRAAVSLSDDFRGGLGDWQGYGEWSKQWSYDAATFLNTGPSVVLYTPSLSLTNYRVDFLGQIEKRSLGWVFRAKDATNYHAAKITLTRGGPLPRAIIEHYAVINGREDRHQSRPLPVEIRADTLYRVGMEIQDSNFTLTVQGQIVDHWSDNRLPSGGIGFFSARGEQSRLRWVEVSHQYDTLGKLCAFLAPYSLPAREGNQK